MRKFFPFYFPIFLLEAQKNFKKIEIMRKRRQISVRYSPEENFSLIAIECTGESKLKFIISDHEDNQFKMYMENINSYVRMGLSY